MSAVCASTVSLTSRIADRDLSRARSSLRQYLRDGRAQERRTAPPSCGLTPSLHRRRDDDGDSLPPGAREKDEFAGGAEESRSQSEGSARFSWVPLSMSRTMSPSLKSETATESGVSENVA